MSNATSNELVCSANHGLNTTSGGMTTLGRMGGWEDARKDRKEGRMTTLGIDSYT